jgi:hypothetical protein
VKIFWNGYHAGISEFYLGQILFLRSQNVLDSQNILFPIPEKMSEGMPDNYQNERINSKAKAGVETYCPTECPKYPIIQNY